MWITYQIDLNCPHEIPFDLRPFRTQPLRTILASRKLFFPSKNNIYISVLEKATSNVISLLCKNDIKEAFDADTSADDEKRLVKKPAKCTKFSLLSKKAGLRLGLGFIPSKSTSSWDSSSGADSLSLSFLMNFSPSSSSSSSSSSSPSETSSSSESLLNRLFFISLSKSTGPAGRKKIFLNHVGQRIVS